MMRICNRCNCEMAEGYSLQISNLTAIGSLQLVKGRTIFGEEMGKVKVAVCPKCGELSLYFENIDKL